MILKGLTCDNMDHVNKTLYIPLYGKAKVSQMGIILEDRTAGKRFVKGVFYKNLCGNL